MTKTISWDSGLEVVADGRGLVANAGLVLTRKTADMSGLTSGLGACYAQGRSDKLDRGVVLVGAAGMIAGGARTICQAEAMASSHTETFGPGASDTTLWRCLCETTEPVMTRIARVRAKARRRVWGWLSGRQSGFPWVKAGGKQLTGWVVVDLDATLVDAYSDKEGAAGTFKGGYGHHPLGAWCANTGEALVLMLRAGNAGSNTAGDHTHVLDQVFAQVPWPHRSRMLVRIDGAGASHETIDDLLKRGSARRTVLFTCGWAITADDEHAIAALPEGIWEPYLDQAGRVPMVERDGHLVPYGGVAELTGLDTRLGNWSKTLRLIARRVPVTPRDKDLTVLEKATGWRYHISATNIPPAGLAAVPGSTHPQWIDALHRQHAIVEDRVRTGKATGLGHLPSKLWAVNAAWLVAAAIGVDLDAWCRLLGFEGTPLENAEPATMRARVWNSPARLARHARKRWLRFERTNPTSAFIACAWDKIVALPP